MSKKIIYTKTIITQETIVIKTDDENWYLDGLIGAEIAGNRWMKICREISYFWKGMDRDIIVEARKLVNGTS